MSMLLENIKVNHLIVKILFYSYISTYSFYKIKTNDFTLNDAYTYPIKYYFLLDIIPYIYNKDYIYIFHHLTGMFFLNYKPIHLYRFYNKIIILSLSTEVSNIFLKLIYLKIRTKVVKVCFIITFLYRFYMLHVVRLLIIEEKDTFVTHDYTNLYNIIWVLFISFYVMHLYWLSEIIKKSLKK
jgi:hypothetical protein